LKFLKIVATNIYDKTVKWMKMHISTSQKDYDHTVEVCRHKSESVLIKYLLTNFIEFDVGLQECSRVVDHTQLSRNVRVMSIA